MTVSLVQSVYLILTSYAWPETTAISFWQALLLINHTIDTAGLIQKDEQIKQKLPDPIPNSHPSGTTDSPVVLDLWQTAPIYSLF